MVILKKAHIITLVIVLITLIIVGICVFCVNNVWKNDEYADMQDYTPQEEISDAQMRKTIVSLYFKAADADELVTEARLLDAKLLLNDPYTLLLTLLIQGPQNSNSVQLIPANTIINKVELSGDVLTVDLSEAFVREFQGDDVQKRLAIYSMLNTLTQLNEVNKLRILINGEAGQGFDNSEVNFNEVFARESLA